MPANLTPRYLEAEAKFKQAKTVPEKIQALEIMMAVIPKHKGTEKIRGQLKGRMAKLKEELQRKPALNEPVVLKKGSTVGDVALSVHKDFAAKLRYAKIWGSGKFDGQMVKRDHQVNEGDVIELHI